MKETDTQRVIRNLVNQISNGENKKFAELVGRSPQQISDWCNGHRNPTFKNFLIILEEIRKRNIKIDYNKIFDK